MIEAKGLLASLMAEVEAADTEMFHPNSPVKSKNETILGVCEDPLIRKLWAVSQFYRREAEHARVDANINGTEIKYDGSFNRSDDYADGLLALFWLLLREQHGFWDKGGIGIRQEWKIVKLKDDDEYNSSGGQGGPSGRTVVVESGPLPDALKKLLRGLE